MRGKGGAPALALRHVGITPAYAGKSTLSVAFWFSSRDHPRVCGEKAAFHA